MNQVIKATIALGIALVIMFAVRGYAFTICSVPTDISSQLRRGDRVLVNKMVHAGFRRGDLLVFGQTEKLIGAVEGVPGDTVRLNGRSYRIPMRCCGKCGCPDCKIYLVSMGKGKTLVHQHQVIGKAHKLFRLPF